MKSVMLVDDSETILLLLSYLLTDAGHVVATAHDATEALARFGAGAKTDLLITDLIMPELDGIEFIRKVREFPAYKFMPILIHSTDANPARRAEAKTAGASGWLAKPTTANELLDIIRRVM